jgi:hypothetical protein
MVTSGDMICISIFIKTGSGIQKQIRETYVLMVAKPKSLPPADCTQDNRTTRTLTVVFESPAEVRTLRHS